MLTSWMIFPAVRGVLCLGNGSLVGRIAVVRLPLSMRLGAGFALIVVVAGLATLLPALAPLATPIVVVLAFVGLAFMPRKRLSGPPWIGPSVLRRPCD